MIRQDPDNPLIWYVRSEEDSKVEYTANLSEWHCNCRDFECRKLPMLKEGYHEKACMCKHMRKALEQFGWTMLQVLKLMDKNSDKGI